MQETYIDDLTKLIRNKYKLQKILQVKITNKGKITFVEGNPEDEFLALEVLEAMNMGFSADRALLLKREGNILQTLNIKGITRRNDLERIRARIIGKNGKVLKTINNLTNCPVSLKDNKVAIIGDAEEIEEAIQAITSLILGSKHGNVYSRTEKGMKKKRQNFKVSIKNELK